METENPYVEQPERIRYDVNRSKSDRLRALEARESGGYVRPMSERLLLNAAYAEGEARRVRQGIELRVPTQVYRAPEPAVQEVQVAEPLVLERRLDPVA